jgi:hypothetical protein
MMDKHIANHGITLPQRLVSGNGLDVAGQI